MNYESRPTCSRWPVAAGVAIARNVLWMEAVIFGKRSVGDLAEFLLVPVAQVTVEVDVGDDNSTVDEVIWSRGDLILKETKTQAN